MTSPSGRAKRQALLPRASASRCIVAVAPHLRPQSRSPPRTPPRLPSSPLQGCCAKLGRCLRPLDGDRALRAPFPRPCDLHSCRLPFPRDPIVLCMHRLACHPPTLLRVAATHEGRSPMRQAPARTPQHLSPPLARRRKPSAIEVSCATGEGGGARLRRGLVGDGRKLFSDPSAVLDHNKVEARPWRVKK